MELTAFLAAAGWGGATSEALAQDASSRSYVRLSRGRDSAILMQDPEGDVALFARLAEHLRGLGLSAPEVLARAPEAGLLLLEDLGDDLFARLAARSPALEPQLYDTAVDVLIALRGAPPPPGLTAAGPALLAAMIAPVFDYYAAGAGVPVPQDARAEIEDRLRSALTALPPAPQVMVLRDYHAENLLWLPGRTGAARAGLLDFQDALTGPPAYDLASLLQDARRDVPAAIAAAALARYARATGDAPETLAAACALIGLQRNLRILGVFARLAKLRGKPAYLQLLPRVWGHVQLALDHPAAAALVPLVRRHLPAPAPDVIERLAP